MPWCEECDKYLTPSTLHDDGTCPTCGKSVGDVERRAAAVATEESAPWHFKLLVVALCAYLGWRLIAIFI